MHSQMPIHSWESTQSCAGRQIGINSCFIPVTIGLSAVFQSDKVYTNYLGLRKWLLARLQAKFVQNKLKTKTCVIRRHDVTFGT